MLEDHVSSCSYFKSWSMSLPQTQMKGKALPTIAPNLRAATMIADPCRGPRLSLTLDTSSAPVAKSIWSHAFSLLCIPALNFFISIHCLTITTWIMCQHCMELDQQLPSLITLLTLPLIVYPPRKE